MRTKNVAPASVNESVANALQELINEGQKVMTLDDILAEHTKAIKKAAKRGNTQQEVVNRLQAAGLEVSLSRFRRYCKSKGIEFHMGPPKGKPRPRKPKPQERTIAESRAEATFAEERPVKSDAPAVSAAPVRSVGEHPGPTSNPTHAQTGCTEQTTDEPW